LLLLAEDGTIFDFYPKSIWIKFNFPGLRAGVFLLEGRANSGSSATAAVERICIATVQKDLKGLFGLPNPWPGLSHHFTCGQCATIDVSPRYESSSFVRISGITVQLDVLDEPNHETVLRSPAPALV